MAFWLGYTVSQEFEVEGASFAPNATFRASIQRLHRAATPSRGVGERNGPVRDETVPSPVAPDVSIHAR